MTGKSFLRWLSESTKTQWWNDSGDPGDIGRSLGEGAVGITTNPPLCAAAVQQRPAEWEAALTEIVKTKAAGVERAEALVHHVVTRSAAKLGSYVDRSDFQRGLVCAQVNPLHAGNRDAMLEAARRYACWAPNISVKLPVTDAGLDVMEALISEGVSITGTVSFTLPQILAVGEACARGSAAAASKGIVAGKALAVVMIGRIDDYLIDVAADNRSAATEKDIKQAGIAIVKRGIKLFAERGYTAKICVAAARGSYHITELAGAELVMSIHPKHQMSLMDPELPKEERHALPVAEDVIRRLSTIGEFRRAYAPDGLSRPEFITFGVTQRTLAQFYETGWKPLETFV